MAGEIDTGSMGQITVKAAPEVLLEKADAVAARVQSMRRHFETVSQAVNRSSGYWIGAAGDTHRRVYQERQEEIEEALLRFQENAEDLRKIAQNYMSAGREAVEIAESLPEDVIV